MSKLMNLTAAASLLLAALPLLALTNAAHAAPVVIPVGDLNLSSADGRQALSRRTEAAAQDFCRQERSTTLTERQSCLSAVRAEAADKADGLRQTQVAAR